MDPKASDYAITKEGAFVRAENGKWAKVEKTNDLYKEGAADELPDGGAIKFYFAPLVYRNRLSLLTDAASKIEADLTEERLWYAIVEEMRTEHELDELVISVNVGWLPIVDKLLYDLRKIVSLMEGDVMFKVAQVKEKFGGLRFYYDVWDSGDGKAVRKVSDVMVELAELKASNTCERCGFPGQRENPNGTWMRTLCGECLKEERKEED